MWNHLQTNIWNVSQRQGFYFDKGRKNCGEQETDGLLVHCLTLYQTTKFWAWPNWKYLQMKNFNVAKKMISLFDSLENIVEKGENAGYKHFLLFPQCFQKLSVSGSLKIRIVWYRVNSFPSKTGGKSCHWMWPNTPASTLTETSILYKEGHTNGLTDRLIPV